MADIVKIVESLCEKYRENEFVYSRLQTHITNLPKQLESSYEKYLQNKQKNEDTMKLIDDCIKCFFRTHLFFYHNNNNNDTFILYENDTFSILRSNDFSVFIYDYVNKLGNVELMYKFKYRIESSIIKRVKKQFLLEAIPTSHTIQKVISLFYPACIEKRELVKIFLIVLGNSIHKKHDDINLLTSFANKSYLNYLSVLISDILGQSDYSQNIKFKFVGQENIQFLPATLTNIDSIRLSIMDIIVVACHYSTRFQLKAFIAKCNSQTKKILRKFNDIESIYDDFLSKYTICCQEKDISKRDMLFLWKLYTQEELLPQLHNEKHTCDYFITKLKFENSVFSRVQSDVLDEVKQFVCFINKSFQKSQEFELDEFEIDEVISIFCNVEKEELNYITQDIALQSVKYYMDNLDINNNKICNISCIHWGKKQEVEEFVEQYVKSSNDIISAYNAYKLYCSSDYSYKVNKSYFEILYNDIAI